MQIQMFQVYRHLYRSLAGKRQLPVQVEPELLPSLAVPVQDHFGLVRAEPPLAGQRLRLRRPPLLGWMTAARALGLLMQIQMFQVYRHLYRSWAGQRQLPVQVEPELPPSLPVPVLERFGPVQVESPLAGQRLHHPSWVLLEPMSRSIQLKSVEQQPCRS